MVSTNTSKTCISEAMLESIFCSQYWWCLGECESYGWKDGNECKSQMGVASLDTIQYNFFVETLLCQTTSNLWIEKDLLTNLDMDKSRNVYTAPIL